MVKYKTMRELIKQIIEDALKGNITLETFFEKWPENAIGNNFYDLIYLNLESSIEHFPGYLFSNKPDIEEWHQMDEYLFLNIDKALLNLKITNSDILIELREKLISKMPSVGVIQSVLKELT